MIASQNTIINADVSWQKAFDQIRKHAQANNFSFCAWRRPGNKPNILVGFHGKKTINEVDLEALPSGFLAHPYHAETEAIFIDQNLHVVLKDQIELVKGSEELFSEIINGSFSDNLGTSDLENLEIFTSKQKFVANVEKAIEAIGEGQLLKVVPSKTKTIVLKDSFDLAKGFYDLCQNYPNAFVSTITVPGYNTWLGATPELLISQDSNGVFETAAVAGTQVHNGSLELQDVPWTQKEIEEQALVSRYIIDCFKTIRLREFEEVGPKTVVAGNLLHLKTEFKVDTKATNFANLGTVMLKLLHPTSAVCGMPRGLAQEFLDNNEDHARKLFAGYLGPVNMQEGSFLFVNLRCMEIIGNSAVLFAGAGVTQYSKPEKEWIETEMKCNTLLNIINSDN